MKPILPLIGLLLLASCDPRSQNPESVKAIGVQLVPHAAEQDIRNAFKIDGRSPVSIAYVRRMAREGGLEPEERRHERPMICFFDARQGSVRLQLFLGGLDPRTQIARRYLVVYSPDGRVLCIEARHEHGGGS